MARIEGIRILNFRALRDVTLGRVFSVQHPLPLTPMTAVIGKNGAGKSTLFDAFGFLADCLGTGVEEAFDLRGRGGFERVKSHDAPGPLHSRSITKKKEVHGQLPTNWLSNATHRGAPMSLGSAFGKGGRAKGVGGRFLS
jgi:hypothetical protein